MKFKFYPLLILLPIVYLFCFCSEEEKELEESRDILFSVYAITPMVTLEPEDKIKQQAIETELKREHCYFANGAYIEMFVQEAVLDIYANRKDYDKGKKQQQGSYEFKGDKNNMIVAFTIGEGEEHSFTIKGGALGDIFYEHFTNKQGITTSHIEKGLFCLHEDFTDYIQQKYPEIKVEQAVVRTDMMTQRILETSR